VTDNMARVQTILEGKCLECAERLPYHTIRCPLNPAKQISEAVGRLQTELESKLQLVRETIESGKATADEIMDLIEQIKLQHEKAN